jgi:PAS domain S-box-containing protein
MDETGLLESAEVLQQLREALHSLRARTNAESPSGEESPLETLELALSLIERHEELLRWQERQQQAAVQEANTQRLRYRDLFDFAPDVYLITDLAGIILQANHAAPDLFQMRKVFLVNKPLGMFVEEGTRRDFYFRLYMLKHQPEIARDWEIRLKPANAEPRDVILAVTPYFTGDGEAVGFRWMLRDITLKKQAERALRVERDFVAGLIATSPSIILLLDDAGRIVRTNPFLCSLSGYRLEELLGQDWCKLLIAEQEQDATGAWLQEAKLSGNKNSEVHTLISREGKRRAIAWSCKSLPNPAENAAIVVTGQDITALHEAQERALQTERLAAIGQMIAGLAHESRNALQRSQSCISLLELRLHDQPESLNLLERLQKSQDDVSKLFEDVRSYAAPIRLQSSRWDVADTWRQAWLDLERIRKGRDIVLVEQSEGVDLHCLVDPFRLRMVFRNLLENAFSACPDPLRITIRAACATLNGEPALELQVHDNGSGFGDLRQEQLFEPFFTTKTSGTGLGLAICKRIIDAHNGTISARNGDPTGAHITIRFPRGES